MRISQKAPVDVDVDRRTLSASSHHMGLAQLRAQIDIALNGRAIAGAAADVKWGNKGRDGCHGRHD